MQPDRGEAACVTCGTMLHGPYCHACGEHSITAQDHRLSSWVREAAAGVFDLDSRLWRSFSLLLRRPGFLTAEYIRGRRRPYIAPLQFFLVANLVFFLVLGTLGGFSTFTTTLSHHRTQSGYGPIATRLVDAKGAPGSLAALEYEQEFDRATPRYANSMVIIMVPLLALLMKVLAPRRFFVHHLTFAFHFMTFLLLFITVTPFLITLVLWLMPGLARHMNSEIPASILLLSVFLVYLGIAWHRAYDGGRSQAWLRAAATVVMLLPVITVFRMILFFVVYYRT